MEDLCFQIDRLEPIALAAHKRKAKIEELRTQTNSIPEMKSLERLLRYETTLERGFDRALSQLERLQRARLGQALPPPLRVELTR